MKPKTHSFEIQQKVLSRVQSIRGNLIFEILYYSQPPFSRLICLSCHTIAVVQNSSWLMVHAEAHQLSVSEPWAVSELKWCFGVRSARVVPAPTSSKFAVASERILSTKSIT